MNNLFQSILDYTFHCDKCGEMCLKHHFELGFLQGRYDDEAHIPDAKVDAFLASWVGCGLCGVCERHAHEAQPLISANDVPAHWLAL